MGSIKANPENQAFLQCYLVVIFINNTGIAHDKILEESAM
jgi:cobalamin biosynthesis protein CbiG